MMKNPSVPALDNGMPRLYAILIFAGSLLLFAAFTMDKQFHGLETRFVFFVQEMQRTGFTWYPHTNFGPYPDYPGTLTWLLYALTRVGVNWPFFQVQRPRRQPWRWFGSSAASTAKHGALWGC